MKKILISLIFLTLTLLATDRSQKIKIQILEKVFSEINPNKNIKIWCDDKDILSSLKTSPHITKVSTCENSNIIILQNKKNLKKECLKKDIFVLNYNLLSEIPNSFGSLFWKKGRPNIVLLKPRINKKRIKISKELEPYLEEKIW